MTDLLNVGVTQPTIIIEARVKKEPPETFSSWENVECRNCDGSGHIPCDRCEGTGKVHCDTCEGLGHIEREIEITSEEMEARESLRRQENLLRRRYGTQEPKNIRDYWVREAQP